MLSMDEVAAVADAAIAGLWASGAAVSLVTMAPERMRRNVFVRVTRAVGARGMTWTAATQEGGWFERVSVPKRWFTHMYIVGTTATALLLTGSLLLAARPDATTAGSALRALALALFLLHVTRRLYESAAVAKHSPGARMHLLTYLLACAYYTTTPISFLGASHAAHAAEALLAAIPSANVTSLAALTQRGLSETLSGVLQGGTAATLFGVTLFVFGNVAQHGAHASLAALRRSDGRDAGKYRLPHGMLFEGLSCPHFTAEIVLYAGLLFVVAPATVPQLCVFAFVVGNLTSSALDRHAWYKARFKSYPAHRRAIFPGVL
ncbi:unnamed protein product [Pedinophyceae sp. YPF-701]|nr:unnamed protein product [Pedinophyceae sp. YPF-701]